MARGIPAAKMMPGTGMPALTDTVLLTKQAADVGCRGALLLPPFYYKNPTEDGLFAYFSEVINRVGTRHQVLSLQFPAAVRGAVQRRSDRASAEGVPRRAERA